MDFTTQSFDAGVVANPNLAQVNRGTLYDSLIYPGAGTTLLTFFSLGIGQGITSAPGATAGTRKTYADTNLDLNGQIASGNAFRIESITLDILPGTVSTADTFTQAVPGLFNTDDSVTLWNPANDVYAINNSGWVELYALNKTVIRELAVSNFPPRAAVTADPAVGDVSATTPGALTFALARAQGKEYYVEPYITLTAGMNFALKVQWPGLFATPSGFNARMIARLHGTWMQATQ